MSFSFLINYAFISHIQDRPLLDSAGTKYLFAEHPPKPSISINYNSYKISQLFIIPFMSLKPKSMNIKGYLK